MAAMKIWVHGISGRMGSKVSQYLAKASDFELVGGSDQHTTQAALTEGLDSSEGVIDFSSADGSAALLESFRQQRLISRVVLVASTGLSKDTLAGWRDYTQKHNLTTMVAPNTSFGILMLYHTLVDVASRLIEADFDVEVVETHHRHKVDAPSGTAIFLAEAIERSSAKMQQLFPRSTGARKSQEIGMHAIRGGGVFGEHEVRFISEEEEFYIGHRALSRDLFAKGAVNLFRWLQAREPGYYTYDDAAQFSKN
jgi:4-hydroxy-tetrahydrodipicolinate reductase